jgi:CheY-like chemotaxis protein
MTNGERTALLTKLKKQRLLVVDDTALNRKIFRKVLRQLFAEIDEAENGLEAVDIFHDAMRQGKPYHVIMMDFLMPVMDGLEATKRIRNESTYPVVIVGVTGNGWEADIDLFIASGADHVLMKPLDVEKFLCVLSQAPWL